MQIANPFYAARFASKYGNRLPDRTYNVLDLFSGIGGFSLGLEHAGMKTVAFCEIDGYCKQVLARHWPGIPVYDDIRQLNSRRLHHDRIPPIDIICGGYPCQPFSIAGNRRGIQDPRHLWPEMYRLIREIRPRWVICENVPGHVELGLDAVLDDLENAGYTATPFIIPACAVGAPHRRDRIWIVAHAARLRSPDGFRAQSRQPACELSPAAVQWDLPTPFTVGSDDGVPDRLDRARALGNAVVPQIPEVIGRAIMAFEKLSVVLKT